VLHLGAAEQDGYLAAAAHPVTCVLENEVVADAQLQLPVVGMAHQQPVEDQPGALVDDRRRRPLLVNGHGLAGIDDLISQVEKPAAPGDRHPDEPDAAALRQAGRGYRRPVPCRWRLGAGPAGGALRQPERQHPDSGREEHAGQEPGDPHPSGQPEPAPPSGGGGAGPGLGPGERGATAHHGRMKVSIPPPAGGRGFWPVWSPLVRCS